MTVFWNPVRRPPTPRWRAFARIASLLVLGAACSQNPATDSTIRVAAASDVAPAFEQIQKLFEQKTNQRVIFSFGASGLLAKQIEQGAPFDVFASANLDYAQQAIASKQCESDSLTLYAKGRLSLWTRPGIAKPYRVEELSDRRFVHIAIANPEHAPYGKAAKEALISLGLWEKVEKRMVYAENVRQALQMAESGNADASIVSYSLVHQKSEGGSIPIDHHVHAPIEQNLVVCKGGHNQPGGQAFAAFIHSPESRKILESHGFLLPPPAKP